MVTIEAFLGLRAVTRTTVVTEKFLNGSLYFLCRPLGYEGEPRLYLKKDPF
jgi:hypothetical protein